MVWLIRWCKVFAERIVLASFGLLFLGLTPLCAQTQTANLTIDASSAQFWVQDSATAVTFHLEIYPFDDRSITGSLACPGNGACSGSFPVGTTVTLNFSASGAAAKGIGFIGWNGSPQTCIGLGPCSFVITQDTELGYGFILPPFPPNVLGVPVPALSSFTPLSISTNADVTFTASAVGGGGGHLHIPGLTFPFEGSVQATSDTSGIYTLQIPRDRLSQFTKPVVLAVYADVCDDSCFTNVLSLSINPNNCLSGLQPGVGASLFDPVPALLDGAAITTDITALNNPHLGRPVVGVAADGVAQLVVRIPACKVGENIIVTVLDDSHNPSDSPDNDGGISMPGQIVFQPSVIATAEGTDSQPIGVIAYRSPIDFSRDGHPNDTSALARYIFLQITLDSLPNQPIIQQVKIVRAPVAMVHGIWGDDSTWNEFGALKNDNRFFTSIASYAELITIIDSDPQYADLSSVTTSSLGFNFNAPTVLSELYNSIATFAKAKQVASVQADIIAHSMGGNIVRILPLLGLSFFSPPTYSSGVIHKLISLDTPHFGTPLAGQLLDDSNSCVRRIIAREDPNFAFSHVALQDATDLVTGAVFDLEGDGNGGSLSDALQDLRNPSKISPLHRISTALITGTMDAHNLAPLSPLNNPLGNATLIKALCFFDDLPKFLTVSQWPALIGGDSDAIVPLFSQTNGASDSINISGVIHSDGTANLGFALPSILNSDTVSVVIQLLNTPIQNHIFSSLTP
jgi:hypothetical protein